MSLYLLFALTDITDQLANFQLYLSNSTNITESSPDYEQSGDYGDGIFNITMDGSLARYIHVSLRNPGVLSICELRIFGGKVC